jgi:putative DNA primase/helicase
VSAGPSAADVAAMLFQRRAEWLPRYLPAGRLVGNVFELGSADGDPGKSLPVPLYRQPRVTDFSGDFSGDDLALFARAIGVGDDMGKARAEALAYLGLAPGSTAPPRPRPAPQPTAPDPKAEANRELAQALWREAHPLCDCEACAPGRRYMTSRGFSSWPEAIHFHPACPYRLDDGPLRHTPAILAPVNDHETGYVVSVWRILLTHAGEKIARMGLGSVKGRASRLFWADGPELALAEGVEDALAFAEMSGWPTWAALSADNLAALILPARFRRILVAQDNDPPDKRGRRPGPDAAQALARQLLAEGRTVEIVRAIGFKDANAALQARRSA